MLAFTALDPSPTCFTDFLSACVTYSCFSFLPTARSSCSAQDNVSLSILHGSLLMFVQEIQKIF